MTDALRDAIAWQLRLPEADEAGWTRFVAWLEADPVHAAAYDEISVADAARKAVLRPLPQPANDTAPARRHWRTVMTGLGSAAACAVAALLVATPGQKAATAHYTSVAAEDGPRELDNGDGVRLALRRGAKMRLDPINPRFAALDSGSADFTIRHDAAHPFRLDLGGHALVDTGTVFHVTNAAGRITVSVSEGGVTFDPDRANVAVHPGQRLVYDRAADTATLSAAPAPTATATTHAGSLSFVNAPFGEVTAALGRASDARITLDPALSGRRFTGVIKLSGSAARDVPHFAEATGTIGKRDGEGWRIGVAGSGSR